MKKDKTIKLYVYVDGVNEAFILSNGEQFITSDGLIWNVRNIHEQIEIGSFRYDAKRMGGAPTISCTLMYEECLDRFWNDNIYAIFNEEKYFLKQTPTSSLSNEDSRYRHDLELVSERVILDNVYFFDAVVGDPQGDDKPVSNSTKVVFFGNIHEFAKRLNSSLQYAKLQKEEGGEVKGYKVVVDSGVSTEGKLMSFEDAFFSNVLQEIYNTYKVPYYFEGKTIHIGYTNNAIPDIFAYGVDNALLSITKNNANFKTVNRVTGIGSSDNIPFYYPNNSPKGEIGIGGSSASRYTIVDGEAFAYEAEIGDTIRFTSGIGRVGSTSISFDGVKYEYYTGTPLKIERKDMATWQLWVSCSFSVTLEGRFTVEGILSIDSSTYSDYLNFVQILNQDGENIEGFSEDGVTTPIIKAGNYTLILGFSIPYIGRLTYTIAPSVSVTSNSFWYNATQEKETSLSKLGLVCSGSPMSGDTITQELVKYVKTSQNLMPSIYRETDGAERFYNAINGLYKDENGRDVVFNNPYEEGKPREHIIHVDDLKPTIKGVKVGGLNIDMFSEFAYDEDDNDETYEDEEGNVYFKHPYFYGKLRRMDFNLFDHAIENQPMTISFTSGDCGACNFEIGVTEDYPQKNPVQVDDNGNLVRDKNGMVLAGVEGTQQKVTTFQDRQQDTSKYEVWIALRKEEETYGILMPQVVHRPKACSEGQNDGDTFVILGINLPESYIVNAEKRLEAEIIKYMKENNDEKFTFSINFSRIFFEENPRVLELLNENARINIAYGKDENDLDEEGNPKDKIYTLYVSSFSYTMSEGDVLPEIRVELDEALTISQNPIQKAISEVRSEFGRALSNVDMVALSNPYFIRKDTDDVAMGTVDFRKGIKFGEGGKVEVLDNNSAKLTIEYLEVTKKASFTSLEIQEKTHVGGQLLVTPAALTCGEVEEFDEYYRCYFQTKNESGEQIFNKFAVGDQAICQTYNDWGSRYYWRLVVGVGEDYIDLSKSDCDLYSSEPQEGDKIIQLGNREDTTRQAAVAISAFGENTPSIIQYSGINSFSLVGKNITGMIFNDSDKRPKFYVYGDAFIGDRNLEKNFITFQIKEGETEPSLFIDAKVKVGAGSSGLSNLSEWSEKQTQIDNNTQAAKDAQEKATAAKNIADEAKENAYAAQQAADNAQTIAESAEKKMNTWASDGIISPFEKMDLKTEVANAEADYIDINKQLLKYTVVDETTLRLQYTTAYDNYINKINSIVSTEGAVPIDNLIELQSAYYTARTNILEAIAVAVKKVADDAEVKAAAAESAAAAAAASAESALSGIKELNDDNYLTITEKRSIRQVMQAITSQKGTAWVYSGTISRTMLSGDNWIKVTPEEAKEDNTLLPYIGFYRSQNRTDNSYSTVKLTFTLEVDAIVEIEYASYAESNYDFLVIAPMDYEGTLTSSNYTSITEAITTKGYSNKIFKNSYGLKAGTHTLQIMYKKDVSGTYYLDSGFYRITTERVTGENDGLTGSFHETFWQAHEKIDAGYDTNGKLDRYAEHLVGLLEELTTFLVDTCALWVDETTILPKDTEVRDLLSSKIREYYKYEDLLKYNNISSDSDYLTNIFGRGTTEMIGGAILNQAVAVRNEEGVIEGILNGSDNFSDTTHGKAILVAGIPEVTEENSTELVDRVNQALTTIFKDGTIRSERGDFAGLKIGKYKNPLGQEDSTASVFLERTASDSSYKYSTTVILRNGGILAEGNYCSSTLCYIGNSLNIDAGADVSTDAYSAVLSINATKKMAIYCENGNIESEDGNIVTRNGDFISKRGVFQGHRKGNTTISGTKYMYPNSELNNTFIVNASSTVNIYLQQSSFTPYDGQYYEFYKIGTASIYLRSNITNLITSTSGSGVATLSITTFYTKVFYSEENNAWYVITM